MIYTESTEETVWTQEGGSGSRPEKVA